MTTLSHFTESELEHFGQVVMLATEFFYDPIDPYAVRMIFRDPDDEIIEWTVARETMTKGLTEMSGGMDVQFWPTDSSKTRMAISLSNPQEGDATLTVPTSEVRAFLKKTEEMLPTGSESDRAQHELELWLAVVQEENP